MASSVAHLKPYRSILLLSAAQTVTACAVRDAARVLVREAHSPASDDTNVGDVTVSLVRYQDEIQASWTSDERIVDIVQQLVLVASYRGYLAIYTSDSSIKDRIRGLIRKADASPWRECQLVAPDLLNAAFLADRSTQTIWMSGTHRRTPSKVDNKVLSARDLRFALDPLADQSFYFTAARATGPIGNQTQAVGVASSQSSLWMGPSKDWNEFVSCIKGIVDHLAACRARSDAPFPVLAAQRASATVSQLGTPYDAAIIPPELLDTAQSDDERQLAEKWADAIFEPSGGSSNLTLRVSLRRAGVLTALGSLDLTLTPRAAEIAWEVSNIATALGMEADMEELRTAVLKRRPHWLKVWYDSSETLADRRIFRSQFRDYPYPANGWDWADFAACGVDVTKEKPAPLSAANIGAQNSLFCWTLKHWKPRGVASGYRGGWLASNDGSMEIADFIHLDIQTRTLTLIHVKGAKSDSLGRQVSVTPYEIVVGQAIKNVRQLDHELLHGLFDVSLDRRISNAVWFNRQPRPRDEMKAAIQSLGSNFNRHVVIIQPHTHQATLQTARASAAPRTQQMVRQLDTLLHGARGTCQAVGADLIMIGDSSPLTAPPAPRPRARRSKRA